MQQQDRPVDHSSVDSGASRSCGRPRLAAARPISDLVGARRVGDAGSTLWWCERIVASVMCLSGMSKPVPAGATFSTAGSSVVAFAAVRKKLPNLSVWMRPDACSISPSRPTMAGLAVRLDRHAERLDAARRQQLAELRRHLVDQRREVGHEALPGPRVLDHGEHDRDPVHAGRPAGRPREVVSSMKVTSLRSFTAGQVLQADGRGVGGAVADAGLRAPAGRGGADEHDLVGPGRVGDPDLNGLVVRAGGGGRLVPDGHDERGAGRAARVAEDDDRGAVERLAHDVAEPRRVDQRGAVLDLAVGADDRGLAERLDPVGAAERLGAAGR